MQLAVVAVCPLPFASLLELELISVIIRLCFHALVNNLRFAGVDITLQN
jgi:uncharacterized protein (DUF697 family)